MPTTCFYAINKALKSTAYQSLATAQTLNPELIIEEEAGTWINSGWKNDKYSYKIYLGNGQRIDEIVDGKWKIIELGVYRDEHFQIIDIRARFVDPTGRIALLEPHGTHFGGVMRALQRLRERSGFESLENYLLFKETEMLRAKINSLEAKLSKNN